ncbi:hypothetical protein QLQ12_34155 [Actinoplanes sp. NEAU-A12]|uniref:Uncharacterized protein n=1 Tax=Actinoplanes sandaracinus TaxID=3045177 RepID=A0ABT6WVF1_9ACTN|nr:hypothetical protein [Actinoplanes sandaracinus]MDI6103669.1 hypothetical protein [Actinoplanes sandaracinus]
MNNGDDETTPAAADLPPTAMTPVDPAPDGERVPADEPARKPRRRGAVVAAAVVALLAAGGGAAAAYQTWGPRGLDRAASTLGPGGYGRLQLGMTRAEAVATGEIGTAPVGYPKGCVWYSLRGGPEPDAALLEAQQAAKRISDDARREADEIDKEVRRLAQTESPLSESFVKRFEERKAAYRRSADSLLDLARILSRQQARIAAAGGVAFGRDDRLAKIAAPPGVNTPEGVGLGSAEDTLTPAYRDRGLQRSSSGSSYEVAVSGERPAHGYTFDVKNGQVVGAFIIDKDIACG